MWISFLGGRSFATSDFIHLSKNGLRILWSWPTISTFLSSVASVVYSLEAKSKSSLKESTSLKISGNKKFNKAHNSVRLF